MLSAPFDAAPKARIARILRRRRASHQPRMRHDRAGDAGAVDMRAFLAAERIEAVRDRVREFRMPDVDSGIDHGDGDVGAMGQRMRLRQSKFRERILRGIALGQRRLLVLQQIAEIRLHRANAGIGGEVRGCTVSTERRSVMRNRPMVAPISGKFCDRSAHEAVTPRQLIGLRVGQRAVDLGHEFVGDRARVERRLRGVAARAAVACRSCPTDLPAPPPSAEVTG